MLVNAGHSGGPLGQNWDNPFVVATLLPSTRRGTSGRRTGSFYPPIAPPPGGKLRVLGIGRISGCASQSEVSLEDQEDMLRARVEENFDGPIEFRFISTKGKGEHLDRDELRHIEQLVDAGTFHLVVMEDLGRFLRGYHAVTLCGRCRA